MADAEHNWCAGLIVSRSRSLTVAELRRIRRRRRLTITKACAWLFSVPIILVSCFATIAISPEPQEPFISTGILILLLLGIFLGVPLCIAIANDHFKRASVLKRQCRDSKVLVCEGAVSDLAIPPRELERLRRQIGQSSEIVLEILMQSSLVWAVNGRLHESWVVVPRGRTVGPPDHARLAARYVRPVETESGTLRLHQRPLSEQECSELRGYLPRIKHSGGIVALLLNAAAAVHVVAYVRKPAGVPLMGVLLLTLAIWCDARLLLVLRARHRMLRDLRERSVVIYQPEPAVNASEESVVEFLPHSRAEWTTGGRAAPWRRLYGPIG